MPRPALIAAACTALLLPLTAGCVANTPTSSSSSGPGTLTVESTATTCALSTTTAPSGALTFTVTNSGTDVTEFYLLAADGLRVVAEVENLGPGLSRDLVVQARTGTYVTQCKPGMVGDGIRGTFTVTDSGTPVEATGDAAGQLAAAEASYVSYVKDQVGALITGTQRFADAYAAGDDATARSLYAPTRVHWERIEPVAESFGDLDPLLDLREADVEQGRPWTGWHLIEKDLWPPVPDANGGVAYVPLTATQRAAAAADLITHTQDLATAVDAPGFTFEAFQIANGAKALLDEVASGKITGEEELWSHTDLWDVQANVDGARVAFEVLRDVAHVQDAELVETLAGTFDDLDALLATYGSVAAGFTPYDNLTTDQVRALAASVDAVGEPLSRLTATVTSAA